MPSHDSTLFRFASQAFAPETPAIFEVPDSGERNSSHGRVLHSNYSVKAADLDYRDVSAEGTAFTTVTEVALRFQGKGWLRF
jgi:hypothetical protein